MPNRSGMKFESKKLRVNLSTFDDKMNRGVTAAFEFQAPKSAARMKSEAPWTDRTGNARSGLFTSTKHEGTRHSMLLAHGVSYGIYLERNHSGRYAIVIPELTRAGQDLMRVISKILKTIPRS